MKPRVPPSLVDYSVLNEFISYLISRTNNATFVRRVRAVVAYEDGTSENVDNYNYEFSASHFAFIIQRSTAFTKNVTKLTIILQLWHGTNLIYKTFMEFNQDPSTGTFVYNANDVMSFKIVFNTNYQLQ